MTVRVLRHPYDQGTRVHHASDKTAAAARNGTAEITDANHRADGSYEYLVRTDEGETESWPSFFTIPVRSPDSGQHTEHTTDSA